MRAPADRRAIVRPVYSTLGGVAVGLAAWQAGPHLPDLPRWLIGGSLIFLAVGMLAARVPASPLGGLLLWVVANGDDVFWEWAPPAAAANLALIIAVTYAVPRTRLPAAAMFEAPTDAPGTVTVVPAELDDEDTP